MSERNLTLLTDLYELTMMQGYFHAKDANETVIFDAFYRTNPDGNGFAITAGLGAGCLSNTSKNLHFDKRKISIISAPQDSSGKISWNIWQTSNSRAISTRSRKEPLCSCGNLLVKVIAPIMQAQLVETAILNIINHQSLIATKTS